MAEDLNFLQQKARDWASMVVDLHRLKVPDAMVSRKSALLYAAKTIKDSIESVIGKTSYLEPINQLGFLPIIGVVAVSSAIAAIVKWTLDYKKFAAEVEQQNKLIDTGMSPVQAANIVKGAAGFSISNALKYGIPIVGLIGAAYFLLRRKGN